ncbi:hypothetical protein Lsan_0435 [Legionella santicrucis]|uniref:Phosphoribosyltransferase n=1 Tax=Legionella santicrucis TaxID=45074 RepID=A0A0W0ZC11_9GAMM|nr:hypothetical protein [Legionella santicrucis]KTD66490.1 hypothetical protein Lsan_0435 [Legionella santicrucis]
MLEPKLLKIDEVIRSNHFYLQSNDLCYYFGDYYARQGYGHSPMNQLIYNFKKYMNRKGKSDWHFKEDAIKEVAKTIHCLDVWNKLKQYTWVPLPSSKLKDDPEFDDRLMRTLLCLKEKEPYLDVRDLFSIKTGRIAAHNPDIIYRPTVQDHLSNFQLNRNLLEPSPKAIAIFDDVITTGASFLAGKMLLNQVFPDTHLIGIFIARNIPN